MKTNRTLLRIVSVILLVCVILGSFSGCSQTPEEEYQRRLEKVDPPRNQENLDLLKSKVTQALEEGRIQYNRFFVEWGFLDGLPYMNAVVLFHDKVKTYPIENTTKFGVVTGLILNSDVEVDREFLLENGYKEDQLPADQDAFQLTPYQILQYLQVELEGNQLLFK